MLQETRPTVPTEVVDATITIATDSQETFLSWLEPHLSEKRPVTITDKDKQKHPQTDFGALLSTIEGYRDSLELEETFMKFPAETQKRARATIASYSILEKVVSRETDGVAELLGVAAASGIIAHLLEQHGMSPAVYATASTLDNSFEMIAEYRKLRQQGFSQKNALRSLIPSLLVLAASIGVATQVDASFKANHTLLGGVLYGSESAICVMPMIGTDLGPLREAYNRLVLEEKVYDPVQKALLETENPTLQEKLQAFVRGSQKAFMQDLLYPHHAGILAGAAVGLGLSAAAASIPWTEGRFLLQWPPILAALGTMDSIGGLAASKLTQQFYEIAKRRALTKLIALAPQIQ